MPINFEAPSKKQLDFMNLRPLNESGEAKKIQAGGPINKRKAYLCRHIIRIVFGCFKKN